MFIRNSREASRGLQNPQMYCAKGADENARVFMAPKYANPLQIKVQFFYEAEDRSIKPLQDSAVLKSGQHVGVAFKAESDCFVYIYWWDSTGQVGRLFPNPQLTEGSGEVKAGNTYWLPSMGEERWYVLDQNPGTETIYFVACRQRNQNLEQLYEQLKSPGAPSGPPAPNVTSSSPPQPVSATPPSSKTDVVRTHAPASQELALGEKPAAVEERKEKVDTQMKRELALMGFAAHTAPKSVESVSFQTKQQLMENMDDKIRVSGADAVFKVQFKHIPK